MGELGIDSPRALREAALGQRLRGVRGLGPKFETNVLVALDEQASRGLLDGDGGLVDGVPGASRGAAGSPDGTADSPHAYQPIRRVLLPQAIELGEALAAGLRADGPDDAEVLLAGSARREVDSVKDIDLVAVTAQPRALARALGGLEQIERVSSGAAAGEPPGERPPGDRPAGARGRTHSGVSVDLRIAAPAQLGNLLQHLTGSGAHNAALRARAVRGGRHVSEYGIADDAATRTCATEEEVYGLLGLAYIEPELRENRGELAAAAVGGAGSARAGGAGGWGASVDAETEGLPQLIELGDMRGDLHCHTVASDGHGSIEQMALAARAWGYEYLAITDHSASHGFGNSVSAGQLREQIERVAEVNAGLDGIELLAGSEVNVLPDGTLDYEDELLGRLDWVVASVHTAFQIGERRMTERMVAAIEHPLVDAIGHPTGRLIERREPYAVDLGAVFAAAARTGTMLEINANPRRRDLSDVHARAAARAGVTIVIDSDAHRVETLANMRWGIATARRAWLTKADVANTRPWPELARMRKRARRGRSGTR